MQAVGDPTRRQRQSSRVLVQTVEGRRQSKPPCRASVNRTTGHPAAKSGLFVAELDHFHEYVLPGSHALHEDRRHHRSLPRRSSTCSPR